MRVGIKNFIISLIFVIIFPIIVFSGLKTDEQNAVETFVTETSEAVQYCNTDHKIRLLENDGSVTILPLEEYILSVVLKEMPANFNLEALKAQAIAARTYTLKCQAHGGKHATADVCSDPSCCQAYITEDAYLNNGGEKESVVRIKSAVTATEGLILLYNGQLIEATYFSTSGGMTESAVSVWGSEIPYLQATGSPGEEVSTHYLTTQFIEADDFEKALGISSADYTGTYIQDIRYTDGGGIESLVICGKSFTGLELRKLLNLKSTAFSIVPTGNGITITTKGYGHRVGMSQYGANAMAMDGHSYTEILFHYYSGVEIGTVEDIQPL